MSVGMKIKEFGSKIKKVSDKFFYYFGVFMFFWLIYVGIHELGHAWNMQRRGVDVYNICLVGWLRKPIAPAWVTPSVLPYTPTAFDVWWDNVWEVMGNFVLYIIFAWAIIKIYKRKEANKGMKDEGRGNY